MGNDATTEVAIPLSQRKIILLLLGSIAFVLGSVWMWSIADTQSHYRPLYVRGVAVAGAIFFGCCMIYGSIKLFDSRPGLIIDREGIFDNSSAVSAGRVSWCEITAIKISGVRRQRFVVIEVVDSRKYVERGGAFRRILNAVNAKMMGSPICISANSLTMTFDELVYALTEGFATWKRRGEPGLSGRR